MDSVQVHKQHIIVENMSDTGTVTVIMAEYNSLRAEILK